LVVAQRLVTVDDLWTAQLDAAASGRDDSILGDSEALEALADEFRTGLREIGDRAYEVRLMLSEMTDEAVEKALSAIATTPGAPADLVQMLRSGVADYEPRSASIAACDYLRDTAEEELGLIEEKVVALKRGAVPPGDLRLPFKCAVMLMMVGAGVVASVGLGGAPLYVGLAVASQCGLGAVGWVEGRCHKSMELIGQGRR
jgi:hypothetical protein